MGSRPDQKPGTRTIAVSLAFALALLLGIGGCVVQLPAPAQRRAHYPVVAVTGKQAYAGTVDNNLSTGTAYVQVKSPETGARCYGQGHLVTASCKGGKGECSLTCDDGRQIDCKYELVSCTSGVGLGQDQHHHWLAFVFGPQIDAANVKAIAARLEHFVSGLPSRGKRQAAPEGGSIGTGFFVSSDGYVVTSNHVIAGAQKVTIVMRSGRSLRAVVVGADPANDLALLKIKATVRPVAIVPTNEVEMGQQVFTLGYPLLKIEGHQQKATFGRIDSLSGVRDDVRLLQTDTPIEPGSSGGPLFDSDGRVVGVVAETLNPIDTLKLVHAIPQNVNYAVKSDYVFPLLRRYGVELAHPKQAKPATLTEEIKQVRDSVVLVVAK